MENLLNLLKQYWKETFGDEKLSKIEYEEKSDCFYWIYQPLPGMKLEQGQILDSSTVLSKKFQFIKWLVENEKIDDGGIKPRKNLVKEISIIDWKTKKPIGWENQYSEWEQLIMYLSIQDNPIEFLVSILK